MPSCTFSCAGKWWRTICYQLLLLDTISILHPLDRLETWTRYCTYRIGLSEDSLLPTAPTTGNGMDLCICSQNVALRFFSFSALVFFLFHVLLLYSYRYFKVKLLKGRMMRVGWATPGYSASKPMGTDDYSYAIDGYQVSSWPFPRE